jgi:hypothetical protein
VSRLKRILLALTILLLILVGVVAWFFRSRAEPIPEQLPEINVAEADPMKVVIPGSAGLPDLKLADLKGKTAYLVVGDRESMQAGESKLFDRALGRWQLPADVVGYAIADTEGFKLFSGKIDEILGPMRPEIRLPLYVDYEGAITKAFKLPKGHVGVVVLGPDGAVTLRHSGPPVDKDDKVLQELKAALRAEEPVLPPAPAFKVGDLDNAACEGKTCMFVFLARTVKKSEMPGVEGGFDGDMEASWKQLQDPSVRLAGLVADSDKKLKAAEGAAAKVRVALVGAIEGIELSQWKSVAAADESRAPFEIPADQAALVIVDASGKLALRELELVRMYKLSRVSELLGVDLSDRRE